MNDKQLQTFIAIANSGSLSKAANQLFLSVPAVKKQLDTLEKELAVKLFYRTTHGLFLTTAGKEFLTFSISSLKSFADKINSIRKIDEVENTDIFIGVNCVHIKDPLYYLALADFKAQYPNVKIHLKKASYFEMNQYDLFLGFPQSNSKFLVSNLLCQMPLMCILSKNNPLATHEYIKLEELQSYHILAPTLDMLELVTPDIISIFSNQKTYHVTYNSKEESYSSYLLEPLLQNGVSIVIGRLVFQSDTVVQIPLHGYYFNYTLYSSSLNNKYIVKAYLDCLTKYYENSQLSTSL